MTQTHASATGIPAVIPFFDEPTNTLTYIVRDPGSKHCALIDSVLDLDYASGTINYEGADRVIAYVREHQLTLDWILETHVHADHLSAAPYVKQELGGRIAIGNHICTVQETFGNIFDAGPGFRDDGSQFDVLLAEGDAIEIGGVTGYAMHTPGHTPACMSYVIGDAVFVGDTLFMPDYGTARCDFPGGDAGTLYRSIKRILALPPETRIFVCHDYLPNGRELEFETTVAAERESNIHVRDGISEAEFVDMREKRDATLGMPKLILPSLQVNMRAGHMPPPETDGRFFLKVPLNAFGGPALSRLAPDQETGV
ncbi:MBL fold metallo-hydrolase [Chromatocurvus halotolerans]|uniref:Glyoxylase-like metal-dependent hydrolase (Beta-lactamase superfamily II) n=1 Tax=Chromatocurvus halotolerans TaxID=1132028 RepID=A0A4R2KGI6_9GAMM|nr:MBL fold metallo-hydrolase [Chromatocurvus halotolerans]TCO72713.1 glyoxylase-like metal-dependent hydrolase (beta-lactamase superfamily II) [Chromatocurvus halotolerans]